MTHHCLQCHAPYVRKIFPPETLEKLFALVGFHSYRCQVCTHVFRRWRGASADEAGRLDHRQYTRLPTQVRVEVVGDVKGDTHLITELSMGGCTLRTQASLQEGTFVQVNLQPQADQTPITVETAIVRTTRPETVGLEFLEFGPGEMGRLGEYVGGLLHSQFPAIQTG